MNDSKILKITITTTIVGLISLMILSGYVNPEQVTIKQIDKSKIDNQVEIEAQITKITTTKTSTKIIELNDGTGTINLVVFPSTEFNVDLMKNQKIKVIGKVTQYNNELELILDEEEYLEIII